jgi:exopolyphosphatase/guanosine-5'-triphosphate,3'-diphosphate pyrophosphatase
LSAAPLHPPSTLREGVEHALRSRDDSRDQPATLAVVDVGSSSVRMACIQVLRDGSWQRLADEREMTRLASSADGPGVLTRDAMERSADAIARFASIARGFGASPVAVATAAVRSASNQEQFLTLVRRVAGLDVAVLSAHDEARAAFDAALREGDVATGPAAVIDIGGGSLQLTQSLHGIVIDRASLPLGAIALTQRVLAELRGRDASPARERERAQRLCDELLRTGVKPRWLGKAASAKKPKGGSDTRPTSLHAFGVGGTFTTLLAIVARQRGLSIDRREPRQVALVGAISLAELRSAIEQLAALPREQRDQVPGVSSDRADIMLCGLVAAEAALRRIGASHVRVLAGGVREGLLAQQARGIMLGTDPRHAQSHTSLIAQAGALLDHCAPHAPHAFAPHARHVAHLSQRLFASLAELLAWGEIRGTVAGSGSGSAVQDVGIESESTIAFSLAAQQAMLHAGALTHDVGVMVRYRGHHKHGARIVRGAAWHGVPSALVDVLALLARYHRRSHPKERHDAYTRLPAPHRALVVRLASVLRIADGLDRTHNQLVEDVRATREGTGIVVWAVPRGGVARAQAVRAELQAASDKAGLLEQLLGCDVDVRV